MIPRPTFRLSVLAVLLALTGCAGGDSTPVEMAQSGNLAPSCSGYPQTNSNGVTICELRQFDNLPATGLASISAQNGDILAQGSGRNTLKLDAYVYATAATEQSAKDIASQVTIHTDNNDFYATGPSTSGSTCNVNVNSVCVNTDGSSGSSASDGDWRVSFAAGLPVQTSLNATSANGVVAVDGLSGSHDISASNGSLYLSGLAGSLTASTSNGSIDLDLDAPTWRGQGVDASSSNGSIAFHAPAGYSAQFDLHSTNGSVHSDFSGQTKSTPDAQLNETTGSGGPTLKASSTNGDVDLLKKS